MLLLWWLYYVLPVVHGVILIFLGHIVWNLSFWKFLICYLCVLYKFGFSVIENMVTHKPKV